MSVANPLSAGSGLPTIVNPKGLRRWQAALADAKLGQANLTVSGDSIDVGVGADGSSSVPSSAGFIAADPTFRTSGFVPQLRALFAALYGDPGEGFMLPVGFTTAGSNVVAAGGAGSIASVANREYGFKATGAAQTLTFTVPQCTSIDIYTWDGGNGTATWAVDGGAATNFSAGSSAANPTFTKTTISGLALADHTLVITGPVGGTVYIAAIVGRKASTGVLVHRVGRSGDTTANLVGNDASLNGNASGQTRMMTASVLAPKADCIVVALGVNDFANQNSPAATGTQPGTTPTGYTANLQTFCNLAVANGACVLLVGEPRQSPVNYPVPATYAEQAYYDQAKAIAGATDHVAYVDLAELWGTDWNTGNALGLYTTNSVHPTRRGHGFIARALYRVLTTPVAPS